MTRAVARTADAEKQNAAVFDNTLYGIFQSTPDGRLLRANSTLARIFGYESAAEMLAIVKDVGSQMYADPSRRAELVRLLTEHGTVSRFDTAGRRKDGSLAWTSVTAQAVRDDAGGLRYIEGAVEDITKQHQAEAAATALAELSRVLSRSIDPDTVGRLATASLCELLNAGTAGVYRKEPGSEALRLITVCGPRQDAFHWFPRVTESQPGMSWLAVREQRAVTSPDVLADPQVSYTAEQHALIDHDTDRAVLAVPLLVRDRTFGALVIAARTGRIFTDDEIALVRTFADQAALALDTAHLVADLRTRESRLETLLEVSRRLAAVQPVGSLLTQIAEACVGLLDAQMVGFRVVEGDELVLSSVAGDVGAFPRHPLRIGQSLSGRVAATGQPLMVPDLSADPRVVPEHPGRVRRQAWMGVPVKIGERVVGVLSVFAPLLRTYSDSDLATATAFAAQAAVALENARLYDEVRTGRDFLESITRNSSDAIVTTDEEGRVTYVSPGGEQMFGFRREEIIGRPSDDLYASGPDEALAVRQRLEREDRIAQYETTLRVKGGRLLDINASISLLRDASGARKGTIAVVRDMTERKRMEANLRQSEKIGAMGSLLAGVAHELNNPLAIVSGHAAILKQTTTDPKVAERAGKMGDAVDRCARIIKNFLGLARQAPAERHTVDVNRLLRDALELLAYPLRVDGVAVSLELSSDVPPLWADGNKLHQVIVNLISNAHHALRAVPPPRQLTVSSRFDADRASISFGVADNGPGVPAEIQARIFEPFFTTKGVGQGTGLGLSLCHGIVTDHGGTIEVADAPRGGALFSVRLPASGPSAHAAKERALVTAPLVPPCTVLVVDDEPDVAAVLAEMLAARGHRVESVSNGLLALEQLAQTSYDVILTDLRMPGLDGRGLYREVERRQPELASRFGFVTGDALNEETGAFLERIGAPHLGKPYSIEDVDLVVRQILARGADQPG